MKERIGIEGKRRWIKLYPSECINGSIRYQLTPEERGVWYDLLCFASLSGQAGVIQDNDGRAYPHDFVANRLFIPVELLEVTLKKCIEEGRITDNGNGIHINNWKYFQSEYDRVKGYQRIYRRKKRSIPGAVKVNE